MRRARSRYALGLLTLPALVGCSGRNATSSLVTEHGGESSNGGVASSASSSDGGNAVSEGGNNAVSGASATGGRNGSSGGAGGAPSLAGEGGTSTGGTSDGAGGEAPVVLGPRTGIDCTPPADYDAPPDRVASRLARLLWNTEPDDELLDAMDDGELETESGLMAQVTRMLSDPKATAHLGGFSTWWLDWEDAEAADWVAYRSETEPTFTEEVFDAMQMESRLYTEALLTDVHATLSDFLTSRDSFLNDEIAPFYGVADARADFDRVTLPAERAGILTQLVFLNRNNLLESNPVRRGYFMLEKVMCVQLAAPTTGPVLPPPMLGPDASTRQFIEASYADPACSACHDYGAVLGYAFENFDAFGRTRTLDDRGAPVDTTTSVLALGEPAPEFADAVSLVQGIAGTELVQQCFTKNWLGFLLGRTPPEAANLFGRYPLGESSCEEPGAPTCIEAQSVADGAYANAACARARGDLYLADLVANLVTSELVIDGTFECGPSFCLRDWEICLEDQPRLTFSCLDLRSNAARTVANSASCTVGVDEAGGETYVCGE